MFKFEYTIINKYDLSNYAGYSFIIDSEYDYIEFFYLNNENKSLKEKNIKYHQILKNLLKRF